MVFGHVIKLGILRKGDALSLIIWVDPKCNIKYPLKETEIDLHRRGKHDNDSKDWNEMATS